MIAIGDNEIHVWRLRISELKSCLNEQLSDVEREKAARFLFEEDRVRYVTSHTVLNTLLALYLGEYNSDVMFANNEYGKPHLVDRDLTFNLSHSGDVALIALSRGVDIGVDVERVRSDIEFMELADRFFCQEEVDQIRTGFADECLLSFYRCWVRKEAFVKGVGVGLSMPLDSFCVPTCCIKNPVQVCGANPCQEWFIEDVNVPEGYHASLSYKERGKTVIVRDYKNS